MDESTSRELDLEEIVGNLPSGHHARIEYAKLRNDSQFESHRFMVRNNGSFLDAFTVRGGRLAILENTGFKVYVVHSTSPTDCFPLIKQENENEEEYREFLDKLRADRKQRIPDGL